MFITFEGGEGTGKSTQIILLAERLRRERNIDVVTTREPGGTPSAEEVRNLLVSGDVKRWSSQAEVLLNYAARDSHLREVIRPELDANKFVICDRFIDSTRVYQGFAGGAPFSLLDTLQAEIIGNTMPDFTFVLDVSPSIGILRSKHRMSGMRLASEQLADQAIKHDSNELFEAALMAVNLSNEDRFERMGLEYHEKVREGFIRIVQNNPDRCRLIDASQSIEAVAENIWTYFSG